MQFFLYRVFATFFFLLCIGSFAWGMRRFFVQPAGVTRGMKVISITGTILLIANLYALTTADITPNQTGAACLIYGLSVALFWWSIATNKNRPLSAAFSPDIPAHLVDRGPYRFVRHPFYASYLLTWCAGV